MGAFDAIKKVAGFLGDGISDLVNAIDSVLGFTYTDGISNTRYGIKMEESWAGKSTSFLNKFKRGTYSAYRVNFLDTTPLDSLRGKSIYGNMILGTPPVFTQKTDPGNRAMVNSFVKDSMILSLTPGLPKYNGGQYSIANIIKGSPYLRQTEDAKEMLDYVLRNGLDKNFADRDKRYYTFDSKFGQYFSYLETMLNTLWIKMGLGVITENEFDLFTFFNIKDAKDANLLKTTPAKDSNLKSQYKSSLGFFVNAAGNVSESVNNETFSSGLEGPTDDATETYQKLNYITGMGTGGTANNIRRGVGVGLQTVDNFFSENAAGGIKVDISGGPFAIAASVASAVARFTSTKDFSSIIQSFMVSNGMRVQYPMLWSDSSYSKNINISFNFVSPYGDPLSIFQYVYVPFFSLMTFVLPRQAAENGFVSPFFVRADIPGVITSDLAVISDLTWTKGGESGDLFTKDKLPRAISGTFTITDLYPFLSMVKRISFLSANPSFTVFLDNMAGLNVKMSGTQNADDLNKYWKALINRISGHKRTSGNWNYNELQSTASRAYSSTNRNSLSKNISKKAIPWLTKN